MNQSFAHGVATTSLVGGIIMAAGTLVVLAVLPGRRRTAHRLPEDDPARTRDAELSDSAR